ncbi:hypothetical protein AYL99_05967 [Fonsecaea erecta]|uniref:Uncharacterized protein n=1 Tax=Fonsecaea erecta TaxID=1367422 RepID=A0A178ZPN2_9EURO|nr:hypothetical protein AYL99_05967 [Fonsecaea erecta]OAP60965.1 hypothetical protein AYL99_05967 [Fonsecaea erecta]
MPSKYSHSVVLANYSRRGIISLPNDEKPENQKAFRAPRILPGKPPPHEPIFSDYPGARASSGSSYQARSSTWQPRFPGRRLSKGQRNSRPGGTPTSQRCPQDEVSNNIRVKGTADGTRPHTSERKIILDSETEGTVNGVRTEDFWLRNSDPSNAELPTGSRLTSPFDERWGLALQCDLSGVKTEAIAHTNKGILKRDKKLLSPVAARKYESGRGSRVAVQPPDADDQPLHRQPRARQHDDAVPLLSARDSNVLPRTPEIGDAVHSRRHPIPRKIVQYSDTRHHVPVLDAADQISKPQKPRRPPLSRANTSFIDMSDDEISNKSRGHTPHTSIGKSPSTYTLISEIEVPDSTILNRADDLHGLHGGVAFGTRQGSRNRLEKVPTWKAGLAEPQVQRRPVSMGSNPFETTALPKRAALHRRQTDEPIRHSVSRSPVLESRSLSWLLLDVGLNNQMKDDRYDEAQNFPQVTLQLPKSEARAKVSNASLRSRATLPSHPEFEPTEADLSKFMDGNDKGKANINNAMKNASFQRHDDSVNVYPPQHDSNGKPSTPLRPPQSGGGGEEPRWLPNSARSEPTSAGSVSRHQHTFSNITSCSVVPETQSQPQPGAKSLASSGHLKLKSTLKSEEEMRMKIPTPIPSPATSSMSPEMSGRRMVWSSSGLVHQASRPANIPEFGVPSLFRSGDQTTDIHGQTTSRSASQLGSNTPQNRKAGPETIRKQVSFPRFPKMASGPPQARDAAPASTMERHQRDDGDDWIFPTVPVSELAASRACLLDLMTTDVEAESRLESRLKSKPSNTWHEQSPNLGRQYQSLPSQIGHSGDMDDIVSLFSNDHEISSDVRDYAHQQVTAGDERDDPDAALPPPDISRYRADRTSSWNRQFRRSEASLTALPRIASTNVSINRLSRAKREDATQPLFWAWNVNRPAPLSVRADIHQEREEKRPRMRTGMKELWGRLRRCIES